MPGVWDTSQIFDAIHRLAFWIFLGVIALAPLPFGSAEPHWITIWLAMLAIGTAGASPAQLTCAGKRVVGPACLVATAFIAVVGLQNISPGLTADRFDNWKSASQLLQVSTPDTVSLISGRAGMALMAPAAVFLSFLCGASTGTGRRRTDTLLRTIMYSGALFALLGIIQSIVEPGILLWVEKKAYLDNLTGTFVNRNTAAAYFGMCSIVWLVHLFRHLHTSVSFEHLTPSEFVDAALAEKGKDTVLLVSGFFVTLTATIMTGSRAGSLLTLASLAVVIVLLRRLHHARRKWIGSLAVAVLAIVLLAVIGEPLTSTINSRGLSDVNRRSTYDATIDMIADRPWLGSGLGTFELVFPAYRRPDGLTGIWDYAHSTPLEIAAELGIPLALMIVIWWIFSGALLLKAALTKPESIFAAARGLGVGLLGICHSAVDFSLQIPGFAIVFAAILGCCLSRVEVMPEPSAAPDAKLASHGRRMREA